MNRKLIKNAKIVNEGQIKEADILIEDTLIIKIDRDVSHPEAEVIDVNGKYIIPGIIDDQVHFREPGLTHKADIASESRAAVSGGVTSFMEMPNTKPTSTSQLRLEEKYNIASQQSWCNYSFFMGAANDNYDEVMRTDPTKVCGVKIFMGSSTGNMLVDNDVALDRYFKNVSMLIATHCEDEDRVLQRMDQYRSELGEFPDASIHPMVRDHEACMLSSSKAIALAKKYRTRLHVLHLTTKDELMQFDKGNLTEKHITAEVCVHHLHYNEKDYQKYGNGIKCNPAIKTERDRKALWKALLEDRIDVIATDHAPHTWEEKSQNYWSAPAGLPLVQHGLVMMLQHFHNGEIRLENIVNKMCHAPAQLFRIPDRGYIKEGYKADFAVLDLDDIWTVDKQNLFYKCAWSNLEGENVKGRVTQTWVNGVKIFDNGKFYGRGFGERLRFENA